MYDTLNIATSLIMIGIIITHVHIISASVPFGIIISYYVTMNVLIIHAGSSGDLFSGGRRKPTVQ